MEKRLLFLIVKEQKTTPSIVAFANDGQRLVGESAKRQAITNPMEPIASIKREMGTNYKKKIGHREYTPQEILR